MQKSIVYVDIATRKQITATGEFIADSDSWLKLERGQWQIICVQFYSRRFDDNGNIVLENVDLTGGSMLLVADNEFTDDNSLMVKSLQSLTPFSEDDPTSNTFNISGDWVDGGTADTTKGQVSVRVNTDTVKFAEVVGNNESVYRNTFINIKQYSTGISNPTTIAWLNFEATNTIRDWDSAQVTPPTGQQALQYLATFIQNPFEQQFSSDGLTDWHDVLDASSDYYVRERIANVNQSWSGARLIRFDAPAPTVNYNNIANLPKINGNTLVGGVNYLPDALGAQPKLSLTNKLPAEFVDGIVTSYNYLTGKPSINGNTLSGNKTSHQLGLQAEITSANKLDASLISHLPSGSTDYTDLSNKPSINNVELTGNKTLANLGIQPKIDGLNPISVDYVTGAQKEITSSNKLDAGLIANLPTGSTNYNDLSNKPSINGHTLSGSMSLQMLGIQSQINGVNPLSAAFLSYPIGWSLAYSYINSKPKINNVELGTGNTTLDTLNIQSKITSTNKLDASLIANLPSGGGGEVVDLGNIGGTMPASIGTAKYDALYKATLTSASAFLALGNAPTTAMRFRVFIDAKTNTTGAARSLAVYGILENYPLLKDSSGVFQDVSGNISVTDGAYTLIDFNFVPTAAAKGGTWFAEIVGTTTTL